MAFNSYTTSDSKPIFPDPEPTVFDALCPSLHDDFPMDGLPLSVIHEFIDTNGGDAAFKGLTTDDVKDRFVVPQTQASKLSICAQMARKGDVRVRPATWFVSHAWRGQFLDLVAALDLFFADQAGSIVLWLDIFSTSQHSTFSRPPEWWQQTFCNAIGRMGQMVMVMAPWDNPISLTRAWCLVEIFACQSSGSSFNVAFPPSERERFLAEITIKSDVFYNMLSKVNTAKSECSRDSDKERIFAAVRGLDGGFIGLDRCVLKSLTTWLVQQLEQQLQIEAVGGLVDQELRLQNALAGMLVRMGEYDRALPIYEESLARRKILLGDDDPSTLESLGGLASLHLRKSDFQQALLLYEDVLPKSRKVLGDFHPQTLFNMHQMAMVLMCLGNRSAGESMLEECLGARERILGSLHSDTLSTMNSLALSYQYRGAHDQARKLLASCLHGRQQILGDSHPETLATMSHLGTLFLNMGFFDDCEQLFVDCLEGRQRILGEHPDTFSSMSNLASLYRCQKRLPEAEALFLSCLKGRQRLLGATHSETLSSINNLALLMDAQGRLDEAEKLHLECLHGRTSLLGETHPDTLSSMNNLGLLYTSQNRHDAAEAVHRKCLEARITTLGSEHPSSLSSMNNLANSYRKQGKYGLAYPLYQDCLEGRKKTIGALHIETLSCKINIASLLAESNDRSIESELLFRETIREGSMRYGPDHPRLISWKRSFADRFGRDFIDGDTK
jgi:tetratricopeptide (TPR) repeat protein